MPETATAVRELSFGEAIKEAIAEEMRRDPTVVLMRRFDRAHRRIITGPSTATAAGIQHWIAEFDGVGAGHMKARPLGRPSAAPRGAARVGSTVVRAAPDRRNLPRSVRVRADGACPQAS